MIDSLTTFSSLQRQNIPRTVGYLTIFLGALIVVGWISNNSNIIQIRTAYLPLYFNTALVFIAAGIALCAVYRDHQRLSVIAAGTVVFFGLLGLVQLTNGSSTGLEYMFIAQSDFQASAKSPNTMPPGAALCFLLIGTAMLLMHSRLSRRWKYYSLRTLALCVVFVASVALVGALSMIPIKAGWHLLFTMSALSATGFLILSAGILLHTSSLYIPTSFRSQDISDPSYFPQLLIYSVVAICCTPFILTLFGVDFSSNSPVIDIQLLAGRAPSNAEIAEHMFAALSGGLLHALLEWSAVTIAGFTAMLSFVTYKASKDIAVPILGMALFCAGLIDAFHTLAATRLIDAVAENNNLIPFTWALSRGFHAGILILGAVILLWFQKGSAVAETAAKSTYTIAGISLSFVFIAYVLVHYAAVSQTLPQTQFPNAAITRPYDALPLGLFLIALPLFWHLNSKKRSPFAASLVLSIVPVIALEAHMAFGSSRLFDNDFNIAHFMKVIAYLIPAIGLLMYNIHTHARRTLISKKDTILQHQLRAEKLQAVAAADLKADFLATMSHEIRTPMNGVIGTTCLLLDTPLSDEQRHYAETTMRSANALLTLLNDILDFSKIEAGKLSLEIVPFDMQTLAEDVTELFSESAREKNIELLLHFPRNTHRIILGDPGRIRQIMVNLVGNAIKFTNTGHVVLSIHSQVENNGKISFTIEVEDTGIGIPEDKQSLIFHKFSQADTSTTRQFGGTGLGLSICSTLATLMRGTITLNSTFGQGSCFRVTLQLDANGDPAYSAPELTPDIIASLKNLKILAVDDVEMSLLIVFDQLAGLGVQLDSAFSGALALSMFNTAANAGKPYDVVITDSQMPRMDGFALAKAIKDQAHATDTKLILMTSSPQKVDNSTLQDAGFAALLSKPLFPCELPRAISSIQAQQIGDQPPTLVTRHSLRATTREKTDNFSLQKCHILLAEDNPVNLLIATNILEKFGCFVTPAGNGLEAVASTKNRDFDLIFMDCQMPEMDGFEATRALRAAEKETGSKRIPVIAFTASAMESDRQKCLAADMDDFLSKPVRPAALEAILKKWIPLKISFTSPTEEPTDVSLEMLLDYSVLDDLRALVGAEYIPIIESFIDFSNGAMGELSRAVAEGNAEAIHAAAHSYKASSQQLGAMRLSELARQMEALAQENNLTTVGALLDQFKQVSDEVNAAYTALIEKERGA